MYLLTVFRLFEYIKALFCIATVKVITYTSDPNKWGHSKSTFAQNVQFLTALPTFVRPCLFYMYSPSQRAFVLVSYPHTPPPPLSPDCTSFCLKKFRDVYEIRMKNRGVKREKRNSFFCKFNIKDQCFLHSYIYNDNKNIYKFIKLVNKKKMSTPF